MSLTCVNDFGVNAALEELKERVTVTNLIKQLINSSETKYKMYLIDKEEEMNGQHLI